MVQIDRATVCAYLLAKYAANLRVFGELGKPGWAMAEAVVSTAQGFPLDPLNDTYRMFKQVLEGVFGGPILDAIVHANLSFSRLAW